VDEPGRRVAEDGVMTTPGSLYHLRRMYHPLETAKDPKALDDFPFADYTEEWRWEGIEEEVRRYKEDEFFIVGGVGSIYECTWFIRGQQQLLMDLYENPEFAEKLLDIVTERRRYIAVRLAKMGVDCLGLGDDMGHQHGLFMSLPMLKKWILSRWEKVINAAKEINPGLYVDFHSDGKNEEAIPEMMRIGVTAINPVQPECDDPEHLKKTFGRKLVLVGTLSSQTYTFGTPRDVKAEIKTRMETGKRWGGLILSHNNSPDINTPYQNMRAFLEAAEEYGKGR
jgi:uroporphyrinogen decarboxylase